MPGKKAKNKEDWKTDYIRIRLSPKDCQAIKQLAADRGLSVSDLVRTLIPNPDNEKAEPNKSTAQASTHEITLPGYPGTFTIKD